MKTNFYFILIGILFFSLTASKAQTTISGSVLYHNDPDKPLDDVLVRLVDSTNNVTDSTYTNQNGYYTFYNVPVGYYELGFTTEQDAGGIDLADSFLILFHLWGFYTLTPMEFVAADVDGNNVVNWDDYWSIVFGWLVQGYPFPAGDWVFEDVEFTVGAKVKDTIESSGGSSTGDVDGSFQPGVKPEPTLALVENEIIKADQSEKISIPVYTDWAHPASGAHIVFNYPENLFTVTEISTSFKNVNYKIENGQLRISWVDHVFGGYEFGPEEPVFTITGFTSESFLSSRISFDLDSRSHLIDSKGNLVEAANIKMASIHSANSMEEFCSVAPNPVVNFADFNYFINDDCRVRIELYNSQGKMVELITDRPEFKGLHSIRINIKNYSLKPGVYFARFNFNGIHQKSKIVKLLISN